jgi:hypothetical protein
LFAAARPAILTRIRARKRRSRRGTENSNPCPRNQINKPATSGPFAFLQPMHPCPIPKPTFRRPASRNKISQWWLSWGQAGASSRNASRPMFAIRNHIKRNHTRAKPVAHQLCRARQLPRFVCGSNTGG